MRHRSVLFGIAAALVTGPAAIAKPPTLDRLSPPGGQRGHTVAVTASGSFDRWPVEGWADDPAITIKAQKDKGALSISVAHDAKPGLHWIRLADEEGASALKPWIVGNVPEIVEVEKGDGPIAVNGPSVTINGKLGRRGDVDEFAIAAKKGQTLVAAVDANRLLASPMDGVVQIASPEGFVLGQNDDDHGFDPFLAVDVPADGTYLVRIFAFPATPDSTIAFAGGDTYIYRLTLTTAGYIDHGYPLAVHRSQPGPVEAHGWNLPESARRIEVPADGPVDSTVVLHPLVANAVDVRLVSHPARGEREPSDLADPDVITIPTTITGRIAPARDRDVYAFDAKKGQTVNFVVESRSLGGPMDPVLRVTDAAGKSLTEVDDSGKARDAQLAFTAPADGRFLLLVRDLHGHGGERYVYRLTAEVPEHDFQLSLAADRFVLAPGKPLSVPVAIDRKNGFNGPIDVRVAGLPSGVDCPAVRSEPGKSTAKSVSLTLTARAASESGAFQVVGDAPDGSMRRRTARIPIQGFEATTDRPWLTVAKPPGAAAKSR